MKPKKEAKTNFNKITTGDPKKFLKVNNQQGRSHASRPYSRELLRTNLSSSRERSTRLLEMETLRRRIISRNEYLLHENVEVTSLYPCI